MEKEREELIRKYASCEISWSALREHNFDNYVDVLAALGELGLRQPTAPMTGPNNEVRLRGRAQIRELLRRGNP
jgi:hypothetical protein